MDGTANAPLIRMTKRRLSLFCGDDDNEESPARRFAGLSGYYCMGVFMELIASKESSLGEGDTGVPLERICWEACIRTGHFGWGINPI
jgi:hypothetical protein